MKIVKIQGGLGNQMFQYAFALALEQKGHTVFFDTDLYKKQIFRRGINYCHTGFELARLFNISCPEASKTDKKLGTQATTIVQRILRKYFTKKTHIIEKSSMLPDTLLTDFSSQYLEGYWQNYTYFNDFRDKIIKTFNFILPLNKQSQDLLDNINENTVSIHIRRGDFLNDPSTIVLTQEYYNKAIQKIIALSNPSCFIIFSDDSDWVKQHITIPSEYSCTFVDWNSQKESWQDMALMAQCGHNIIANSSFSWWAAYLNKNKEKIVIMPKPWSKHSDGSNLKLYNMLTLTFL